MAHPPVNILHRGEGSPPPPPVDDDDVDESLQRSVDGGGTIDADEDRASPVREIPAGSLETAVVVVIADRKHLEGPV